LWFRAATIQLPKFGVSRQVNAFGPYKGISVRFMQ